MKNILAYKYSEKIIGGRYKNTQNVVAENHSDGTQRVIFTPVAPHETPSAIDEIICGSRKAIILELIVIIGNPRDRKTV